MDQSTARHGAGGEVPEPALIYDAGERRSHAEHAAEAYDFASRAETLSEMADAPAVIPMTDSEWATWRAGQVSYARAADRCRSTAQWHATMAVYEALSEARQRGTL